MADYIVSVNYFAEEPVFDNQGIYLISAIILPVYIVPWAAFWCILMLREYPSQRLSLFCWHSGGWFRQSLGCLFFGILFVERVGHAFECLGYSQMFYDVGFNDLALDAMFNAIAALGAAYFWASLRALVSYHQILKTQGYAGSQRNEERLEGCPKGI